MKRICILLTAVAILAGSAYGGGGGVHVVHSGSMVDVSVINPVIISGGPRVLVEFTLRLTGKGGFLPSSFDGVQRDGVVNGATGVTGLLHHAEADSRFSYDPAATVVIDPVLIGGYTADPTALTGLFALAGGQYGQEWDVACIVTPVGEMVHLDFTVGHAGTSDTEYVGVTFLGLPAADANIDWVVDLDDFAILKRNFGSDDATWSEGDYDGDGDVDLDDFVILKNSFGSTGAALTVPSDRTRPVSLAMFAAGGLILVTRRRR